MSVLGLVIKLVKVGKYKWETMMERREEKKYTHTHWLRRHMESDERKKKCRIEPKIMCVCGCKGEKKREIDIWILENTREFVIRTFNNVLAWWHAEHKAEIVVCFFFPLSSPIWLWIICFIPFVCSVGIIRFQRYHNIGSLNIGIKDHHILSLFIFWCIYLKRSQPWTRQICSFSDVQYIIISNDKIDLPKTEFCSWRSCFPLFSCKHEWLKCVNCVFRFGIV